MSVTHRVISVKKVLQPLSKSGKLADYELAGLKKLGELSHIVRKGPLYQRGCKISDVEFILAVEMGSVVLDFFITSADGKVEARCKADYQE